MFTFSPNVPTSIYNVLIPLVQAWIDRADHAVFGFETMRYGLVSFRRDPWPPTGPTVVSPAGEVDAAALQSFANSLTENPNVVLQ
jgi:hypothetical protein